MPGLSTPSRLCRRSQVRHHPTVTATASSAPTHVPPLSPAGADAEARLRALGFGYRAKFVSGSARAIAEGLGAEGLCRLRAVPYAEARRVLCTLPGVGTKVGAGMGGTRSTGGGGS